MVNKYGRGREKLDILEKASSKKKMMMMAMMNWEYIQKTSNRKMNLIARYTIRISGMVEGSWSLSFY